jgi:hypothetical protein
MGSHRAGGAGGAVGAGEEAGAQGEVSEGERRREGEGRREGGGGGASDRGLRSWTETHVVLSCVRAYARVRHPELRRMAVVHLGEDSPVMQAPGSAEVDGDAHLLVLHPLSLPPPATSAAAEAVHHGGVGGAVARTRSHSEDAADQRQYARGARMKVSGSKDSGVAADNTHRPLLLKSPLYSEINTVIILGH